MTNRIDFALNMRRFAQTTKAARHIMFGIGLTLSLYGQTKLTSGVPVPFYLPFNAGFQNGKNGFIIPIPSDPVELTVTVQVTPSETGLNVYLRCGADVPSSGAAFDTMEGTGLNGAINLALAVPNGGTAENCYVALQIYQYPSAGAGVAGRLTANVAPLPQGTQVTVSSLASLYLAGQPPATTFGTLSVPSNSPPQVPISLSPGQGLNILAAGQLGGSPPEGVQNSLSGIVAASTNSSPIATDVGAFGLSDAIVPLSSLLGVFVGDTIDSTHTPLGLNFGYDLQNSQTLSPQLQQVFYVGNGVTPDNQRRVFVIPTGATRLFLASSAGGYNATGQFVASVSTATIPPVASTTNPMTISGLADLYLVDQPNGTGFAATSLPQGTTGFATALTPYSSPSQVPIALTAGQTLHMRASILATLFLPFAFPGLSDTTGAFGLSGTGLQGELIGVFVGDSVDRTQTPAAFGYSNGNLDVPATQAPLLQQVFYAGGVNVAGLDAPDVTVPSGATRLFLGVAGGGFGGVGSYTAMVTPDNPNAPQVNSGGIVTNAGFKAGPVSPGSMVAIFGTGFGPITRPSTLPLPTNLGGTQVFFNAVPAPLFYVSPTQIVAQVPFETPFGSALVTVVTNGIPGIAQTVDLAPFAAGIFTTGAGEPVIIDNSTGQIVSPSAPASRGDTLIIWATGLGPTLLDPATGDAAPGVASPTLLPIQVTLKSPASGAQVLAPVQYSGLAPGFVALNQINVQIPASAPTGTVILQLTSPGFPAPNPYTIGIK